MLPWCLLRLLLLLFKRSKFKFVPFTFLLFFANFLQSKKNLQESTSIIPIKEMMIIVLFIIIIIIYYNNSYLLLSSI